MVCLKHVQDIIKRGGRICGDLVRGPEPRGGERSQGCGAAVLLKTRRGRIARTKGPRRKEVIRVGGGKHVLNTRSLKDGFPESIACRKIVRSKGGGWG